MVDLRCHGDSTFLSKQGPHSVQSAARDVLQLVLSIFSVLLCVDLKSVLICTEHNRIIAGSILCLKKVAFHLQIDLFYDVDRVASCKQKQPDFDLQSIFPL